MATGRIYVIGERGSGVMFVKTNPFRATIVPDAEVAAYGAANGVDGYAAAGAAAWRMIANTDGDAATVSDDASTLALQGMLAAGARVVTADFAFTGAVDDGDWEAERKIAEPLEDAFQRLGPGSTLGVAPDGSLQAAILHDSA